MNILPNFAGAAAPAPAVAPSIPVLPAANAAGMLPLLFAEWLGQALPPLPAAPADSAGAAPDAGRPNQAGAPAAAAAPSDDEAHAAAPDAGSLAAMAMPLMPLPPAQLVQALQAAQPADASGGTRKDAKAGLAPAVAAAPAPIPLSIPLAVDVAAPRQAIPLDPAQRPAVPADGVDAGDAIEQAPVQAGQAATPSPAGAVAVGAAPANLTPPDTVKLAGPPAAWRQPLQDALGERLNLQLGRNSEQAVIRLEPPQLGRIDIAIRHSAGALEVTISASNGEVLRQLQGVSEHLRNDLAQRQYSEVAVTVAPAPRQQSTPFGDPQQQGRGRQPERGQDEGQPGAALAEADHPGSVFDLG